MSIETLTSQQPPTVDKVANLVTGIAERGMEGFERSYTELHLVLDAERANAARELAGLLSEEFKHSDVIKRVGKGLEKFLENEVDYSVPTSAPII